MYRKFLILLRKAWHAHALFWGKNETQRSSLRSCVVLAPHPDDESIGMGATIARKTSQGTRVVLVVATDGRYSQESQIISQKELIEIRKKELRNAAHVLGIKDSDIYFFDEIDTKIDDLRLKKNFEELLDSLDCEIEEIMSTSWNDSHHDHQACARIAHDVAMDRKMVFRACPIYWWAEGPTRFHRGTYSSAKRQLGKILDLKRAFLSRGYTVDSGEFADIHTQAVAQYASQTTQLSGEKTWATLDSTWLQSFNRRREFFVNR